jgi:hypothetical protein
LRAGLLPFRTAVVLKKTIVAPSSQETVETSPGKRTKVSLTQDSIILTDQEGIASLRDICGGKRVFELSLSSKSLWEILQLYFSRSGDSQFFGQLPCLNVYPGCRLNIGLANGLYDFNVLLGKRPD